MNYEYDGLKSLACAVVLQACKDYKRSNDVNERKTIEEWFYNDNLFIPFAVPDVSRDILIEGVRNYGKSKA